jgi:hypothetical protein
MNPPSIWSKCKRSMAHEQHKPFDRSHSRWSPALARLLTAGLDALTLAEGQPRIDEGRRAGYGGTKAISVYSLYEAVGCCLDLITPHSRFQTKAVRIAATSEEDVESFAKVMINIRHDR